MRKFVGIVLVIGLLLLGAGCTSTYPEEATSPPEVQEVPEVLPGDPGEASITEGETQVLPPSEGQIEGPVTEEGMTLTFDPADHIDDTWITPSVVEIGNYSPGDTAEYPVYIHNGNDEETEFLVTVITPDSPSEGFVSLPEGNLGWVIIATPNIVVAPKETEKVWISVQMPEDAISPGPKWEFWTGTQALRGGFVAIRLATKWFVTMK